MNGLLIGGLLEGPQSLFPLMLPLCPLPLNEGGQVLIRGKRCARVGLVEVVCQTPGEHAQQGVDTACRRSAKASRGLTR